MPSSRPPAELTTPEVPAYASEWAQSQLLRDLLASVSQGILDFDAAQKTVCFNTRACELLDLDPVFLKTYPLLQDIEALQHQRSDFGINGEYIDLFNAVYDGIVFLNELKSKQND